MIPTNLFYFFGIIPYRYEKSYMKYTISTRKQMFGLIFRIFIPIVVVLFCSAIVRNHILEEKVWGIAYAARLILTIVVICTDIFDNFYHAWFYAYLQEMCSLSDSEAEQSAYTTPTVTIYALLLFYVVEEAYTPLYVTVFRLSLPIAIFYSIYTYLEFLRLLNIIYVGTIFQCLRHQLYKLLNCYDELQQTDTEIARIGRIFYVYIGWKRKLSRMLGPRLLLMASGVFLSSSSLAFMLTQCIDTGPQSWAWNNTIGVAMEIGECSAQLFVLGCFCNQVEQCTKKEQELARKLSDLNENFSKDSKESPSTTMTKISVLYRPPAISAYGLFDINLNFFYQMIAAIFTQCVILFQFQSFESH